MNLKSSTILQIVLIAGALFLFIFLYQAPRLPENVRAQEINPADQKLAQAVELVHSGQEPMRGITMIREILQEDSTNAEAHWHLAQFSIQSGQYENAIDRFKKVTMYDGDGDFSDSWFYLGRTYATVGDTANAISAFEKYKTMVEDTLIINGVDRFIQQLQNK